MQAESVVIHFMSQRPHNNCYWLLPGLLLAGEYPAARGINESTRKLSAIVSAGIRHFIDLTERRDLVLDYEALLTRQFTEDPPGYDRYAIPDMGIPDTHLTNSILDRIDGLIKEGRPVYVHCWGGVGRTGTIAGCWLVRHGLSGDQALAEIARHWQLMEKRDRYPRSPETEMQAYYVQRWTALDSGTKHRIIFG